MHCPTRPGPYSAPARSRRDRAAGRPGPLELGQHLRLITAPDPGRAVTNNHRRGRRGRFAKVNPGGRDGGWGRWAGREVSGPQRTSGAVRHGEPDWAVHQRSGGGLFGRPVHPGMKCRREAGVVQARRPSAPKVPGRRRLGRTGGHGLGPQRTTGRVMPQAEPRRESARAPRRGGQRDPAAVRLRRRRERDSWRPFGVPSRRRRRPSRCRRVLASDPTDPDHWHRDFCHGASGRIHASDGRLLALPGQPPRPLGLALSDQTRT